MKMSRSFVIVRRFLEIRLHISFVNFSAAD